MDLYVDVFVKNGSLQTDLLKSPFFFSDTIHVTPYTIPFNQLKITDKEGHVGYVNGVIRHKRFKNLVLDLEIQSDHLKVMEIPPSDNTFFYGTAYGTGTVNFTGPDNQLLIDINMKTEDRTKVTFSLQNGSNEVAESNFIQFVNPRTNQSTSSVSPSRLFHTTVKKPNGTSGGSTTVNLQLDITPNAELVLVPDPNTGDEIRARGNGSLRVVIKGSKDVNLFGRYEIESGSYRFIYQHLIQRDFSIVKGGSFNFTGDPLAAQVDMSAVYSLDAKLTDLLSAEELAGLNLNRSSIPVNCLLNVSGELQQPKIQLGLEFPNAGDDLKRTIQNLINADEMLNQQIVFLLLFGRFYVPTNSSYVANQSNVSTVLNTAISTLSDQVTNVLIMPSVIPIFLSILIIRIRLMNRVRREKSRSAFLASGLTTA